MGRIAERARESARRVTDRDAVVHRPFGDVPAWDYCRQLVIARSLTAHDLATLGAPSPLTDELSRGAWEGTSPMVDMWRSIGVFRHPVPVPESAPWRDRYLGLTGRKP